MELKFRRILREGSDKVMERTSRRQFLVNTLAVTAGITQLNRREALASPQKSTFRLYPYGSVQFVDERAVTPVSFAHVTDLHLTPDPADDSKQPYRTAIEWWDMTFNRPHQVLPKLLAEIQAAGVDFVFFGGDNIDCYQPQTAEHIANLAREFGLKAFFQSGNHDWETLHIRYVTHSYDAALRAAALQKLCQHWNMPASYYSFELKGIRFIALDPPYVKASSGWAGMFDSEQTEWFLSQLRYEGPIIIFHHIPFNRPTLEYRLRSVWSGVLGCVAEDANGKSILNAIESCPNVLGTFTGHAHIRSEDPIGQTCQFMTAPGSDGQWRIVKIGNAAPPKSLRAKGEPVVRLG